MPGASVSGRLDQPAQALDEGCAGSCSGARNAGRAEPQLGRGQQIVDLFSQTRPLPVLAPSVFMGSGSRFAPAGMTRNLRFHTV
jgi:hypothetical protein